ncbi:88_t:CDS:2 [Entrophospora sp. SA101]|nr:4152_t:CDS:2 [Entrophospora sp. SA101]CAJ0835562.1 88_t:CDS:2 [Entrophospora sp. SA101]CAJ0863782.1 7387_t:CDS:2 [Entrophospora sp. SA101]
MIDKTQEQHYKTRRRIIISFWIVILIGLPFWWKTTEVYRAQLPFTEIEEWSKWEKFELEFPIDIRLYVAQTKGKKEGTEDYFKDLANIVENSINNKSVNFTKYHNKNIKKSIKYPIKIQILKWEHWGSQNPNTILDLIGKNGQYDFYIMPGDNNLSSSKVLVGNQRQAIVEISQWNIASAVSSYPTLNFILYIPSHDQSPLYILDSKENIVGNNAFLIPRWGGVIINNIDDRSIGNNNNHFFTFEELKSVMSIFIMQLRGLLGVQDFWGKARLNLDSLINIEFTSPPNTAITMWELDSLIRRRIAENIDATISTLKSLSQLVTEIPNMVVLDHIQTEVLLALNSLSKSCDSLKMKRYDVALKHAKEAIERAESAFFDPTMVSMLYFPDEHKYAIYMPLFVPISVPLLIASYREIKGLYPFY